MGIALPFLVKMSVPWSLMHKAYLASLALLKACSADVTFKFDVDQLSYFS